MSTVILLYILVCVFCYYLHFLGAHMQLHIFYFYIDPQNQWLYRVRSTEYTTLKYSWDGKFFFDFASDMQNDLLFFSVYKQTEQQRPLQATMLRQRYLTKSLLH